MRLSEKNALSYGPLQFGLLFIVWMSTENFYLDFITVFKNDKTTCLF